MTIADGLILVVRANLVASAAILVILALRAPVRRMFGPHYAYALWSIAPLALFGALLPDMISLGPDGAVLVPVSGASRRAVAWLASHDRDQLLLTVWCIGVGVSVVFTAFSLARFIAAERAGRAGPAVVGVVVPRLVVPADAARRFTPQEWRLVRAHERAHMDRQDGRGAALATLARCVCWFNPLVHLAANALRLDQELACDATVIEQLPVERRRYAETLLRTHDLYEQIFGVGWRGCGSLETRIETLSARPPSADQFLMGELLILLLAITALVAGVASHMVG